LATLDLLEPGDRITIDFHSVVVEVLEIGDERAVVRVQKGGRVGHNKACNVHRNIELPAITLKDRKAIEIGRQMERIITHFLCQPAGGRAGDAALIGADARLISKLNRSTVSPMQRRSPGSPTRF